MAWQSLENNYTIAAKDMSQQINSIISTDILSVPPDAPLKDCIALMKKQRSSCLLITEQGKPLGIYTERDIVRSLYNQIDPAHTPIQDVMTQPVITAPSNITLFEAYYLLSSNKIRHLLIVDNHGKSKGILTQTNIITYLRKGYFFGAKTIDTILTRNLLTFKQDDSLLEIISAMVQRSLSCVVIAEKKSPIGIFTERDAINLLLENNKLETLKISEVMSQPVKTVSPNELTHDVTELMRKLNIRRLVAVDNNNRIKGLIEQKNIIQDLEQRHIESLQKLIQHNEQQLSETKTALEQKRIYLDSILSSSVETAIAATDIHLRIAYFNPRAEKLFGRKAKDVIGRTVMEIHQEEGVAPHRLANGIKKIDEKGEHCFEFTAASAEGNRLLEGRATKILDSGKNTVGYTFISRDITEQRGVEQAIHTLMETTAGTVGEPFFEIVVRRLCVWLDVDCALVGFLDGQHRVTTIAMQLDGKPASNFTYSLKDTPCDKIKCCNFSFHPKNITQLFPNDKDLAKLKAESYVGVALKDKNSNVIGILCAISRRELTLPRNAEEVLNIIAARAAAELERKLSEEDLMLASHVYEHTIEGIMVTDIKGQILSVNPAFTSITGYSAEEAIGNTPRLLKSNKHDQQFYKQMWHSLITHGSWKGEIWNRRKSGEIYPERLTISTIKDPNGKAHRYTAIFYDITDIKESEDKIRHRAFHDPLTELPNRLLFQDRLLQAIAHAKRSGSQLAIMFMDVDYFKNLNDSLGHHMGDIFLHRLATQLTDIIRTEDTVSRVGGDEFTILLTQISSEADAASIANKILTLFKSPFELGGHNIHLGASIGIALYPNDGGDTEVLIRNADTAMYHAKERGRNNYQFFTTEMETRVRERVILEADLRKGLDRDEFRLYYQPIYDLHAETLVGFEALIRWQHPDSGFMTPAKFIPIAEERGLIIPIGEWVLKRACQQLDHWNKQTDKTLTLSINISPHQFTKRNFIHIVNNILDKSGFRPNQLIFEITETAMMDNVGYTIQTLKQLQTMGVQIAMDDFGTGYSSLTYLKQLPIDILKLDYAFMQDVMHDPDSAEIAASIIHLAKKLRLNVIAEGIESAEQLGFLKRHQCEKGQGYLFSKPLPQDKAEALLTTP